MAVDQLWGIDGAQSSGPPVYAYTVLYDYDGSGNLIYIGYALSSPSPSGVAQAQAITSLIPSTGPVSSGAYWAIRKNTYNGSSQITATQWANGNTQMINIWDNRAALSYQ